MNNKKKEFFEKNYKIINQNLTNNYISCKGTVFSCFDCPLKKTKFCSDILEDEFKIFQRKKKLEKLLS